MGKSIFSEGGSWTELSRRPRVEESQANGRGGQREEQVHGPETDMSPASSQNGHSLGMAVTLGVNRGNET